ncbi:KTSC domain-containing protein [Demequina sp.]|uniref:KTSC domain-containing protein n=1 Tax=Demequina sp. TaxID=2050685 RepID=UPI00344B567D
MLDWLPTPESTRTAAIAYDAKQRVIHVEWPNGGHHFYLECSESEWHEFSDPSTSKGGYLRAVLDHHTHMPA